MFAMFQGSDSPVVLMGAGLVILLVTVSLGRLLKRRSGVQLGTLYLLFCGSLALFVPVVFLLSDSGLRASLIRPLAASTLLLGTFFVLALLRRYFWELWFERNQRAKAPKFLSQLIGLVIFFTAVLFVIGNIYHKDITGFVFGSTVVVGIIGFAMQDLLGNIIAGIALELGKPFKTGDWLIAEGHRAEVIEVNWRSTRLRTNDDVYLDIPNKTIVGTSITNLTFPTRQHAIHIDIGFDYALAPNLVKDVLTLAVAEVTGVLRTPPTKVLLKNFADSSVIYEIKFWIEDESHLSDILDRVRTNIWYSAHRRGLRMPFPIRTLHLERPTAKHQESVDTARLSMRKQPFLQLLDDNQASKLLMQARLLRYGRGERVIEQGKPGESMFIILSGEADVHVDCNGSDSLVATLRHGDYVGEMSLLTGEPRSATVIARTDCEMWEIDKNTFAEVLQNNQALVQRFGELLAKRRMETEGVLSTRADGSHLKNKEKEYTEGFLKKLYSFFEL
jgi:small-conductance mechanosensitive channel/CRP-like cAMP-binding protein